MSVLAAALFLAAPAYAQDAQTPQATGGNPESTVTTSQEVAPGTADPETSQDVIVTGTRQALQTSQNIKRNADTVVDTITATDIGAFPDKSVAEALQRVPGISVNRFAASDDTSHFSADPSGILIRGLSQVRSEFNGRDTFSANSSRGLSWGDISPELMAGVDSYKNQTAELIEGGIAGSVNLRTRVPFDQKGDLLQVGVNANYGDVSKTLTPDLSALYSTRFETGIGEFGFLGNVAYSEIQSQTYGVVYGRTAVFDGVYGPGKQYIPSSVGLRDTVYDRSRTGIALAGQFQDTSGRFLATAQYNRSKYEEKWRERGAISYLTDLFALPADFEFSNGGPNASRIPRPAPGSPAFTFDDDGNFETGVLVNQQTDFSWWGASDAEAGQIALNSSGQNMLRPCYSWGPGEAGACGADARGPDMNAVTRYNESNRLTQDFGLNLKFEASDQLHFSLDGQYVKAELQNYDVEVGQYSFANVALDASGGQPTLNFLAPTNINQSPGGLSNPNNYRYNHAMDHIEDSRGTEWAFRGDATYDFDGDWLDALKVGLRYSDRDQEVRYSAYNWGNIVNNWNLGSGQSAYWNIDRTAPNGAFRGYPGTNEVRNFGNDFFGSAPQQLVFFSMESLENRGINQLGYDSLGVGQDQWMPICSGGGSSSVSGRSAETVGCFRDDEINRVSETTKAAYAMLKFGGNNASIGGVGFSGNIGLRYVETKDKVSGATVFPNTLSPAANPCQRNVAEAGQPAPALPYTLGCFLFGNAGLIAAGPPPAGFIDYAIAGSPDTVAFANGGSQLGAMETTHRNWLPSLNLRFDLTPKWLVRFAASRAMSRPDIGLLKNYTTISGGLPGSDPNDARYVRNPQGQIVGVNAAYTASGYNPTLKPITSTMFDLSLEHYFSPVGSVTLAGFYKNFQNYIQYGSQMVDYANNGVTRSIEVRTPINGDGGKIYGFEAAYQQFFDFLPGALKGLGVQANVTYVKNDGITNSGLKTQNGTDGGGQAQPGSGGTTLTVDSLEGLSEWTYNLVGMYERSGLAVRVAYNWRSEFLVTAVDCCTYLPTWQKAAGFLDASVRYAVSPKIEFSIQGTNLLNTITKLEQQVTGVEDGALLRPNAWFRNDRRLIAGVRVKF
ncbi:TonB-dependent receptor [Sphingomonas sp. S2-65]|uniref:TonB-dependent receptor n=1 Tax=Sphingomonas sp. S2-65 TaxID=2903960 RepID=UPI001F4253E0|nr:TonB-dependent receptor [Sphingomonas sp. S2-65]UYY59317.1 TonB-dependent receptor [Sphingomonas sp. S2-65]